MILIISIIVICYCFFIFWLKSGINKSISHIAEKKQKKPVYLSLIIPFRNEEHNLPQLLDSINSQNLIPDKFEIIFVDDHSTDKSSSLVEEYIQKEENKSIKLFHLADVFGKKEGIAHGQLRAKGNYIVQTDADCTFGPNWLKTIYNHFLYHKTEFLILPVHLAPQSTLISKFDSFDYASLQAVGMGMAKNNFPILCSGANLAYSVEVCELNSTQPNLSSGDDIFLLQTAIKNKKIISSILNSDVLLRSKTNSNFKEFLEQRKRWLSKNTKVNDPIYQLVSILALATNISILLAFVFKIEHSMTFLFFKLLSDYLFLKDYYKSIAIKMNGTDFIIAFILYPFYLIHLSLSTITSKSTWKERIVVD